MNLNLNFVFSKLMNLNFIFSKSMNLNFVFSKSMNLNFVFSNSMTLNFKIKRIMNGSNPSDNPLTSCTAVYLTPVSLIDLFHNSSLSTSNLFK